MTFRQVLAAILVRCYPEPWRREYGAEFRDLLETCPLTAAGVADVIVSGIRQRARVASVSSKLGALAMLLMLIAAAAMPASQPAPWLTLVRPSGMTFPPVKVPFFSSDIFILLLLCCGWRTASTRAVAWYHSGFAAARMTVIAGLPVIVVGLLIALGAIDGTLVIAGRQTAWAPSGLAVLVSPVLRTPESWIWGVIGGWLARKCSPARRAFQPR